MAVAHVAEAAPKAPASKPHKQPVKQAAKTEKPRAKRVAKNKAPRAPEPQIRSAFAAPAASSNGLLSGAQPVIPVGSFTKTALR
jgi:hypothetical protein